MIERIQKLERMVKWLYCKVKNTAIGGIQSIVAGDNITVDNSDPANPVVSSTAGSSDGGVITEDSDTVAFTGNGTAGNPLSAESVGGDYIPLAGTEEDKPVTGPIKVVTGISTIVCDTDNLSVLDISENYSILNGKLVYIGNINDLKNYLQISDSDGFIIYDNVQNRGLSADSYYGENYDDNTYIQKKYVDDANSYSTDETLTGGTWIDGKPIYRKVIEFNHETGTTFLDLLSLNIDTIFPFNGIYTVFDNRYNIPSSDFNISNDINNMIGRNISAIYSAGEDQFIMFTAVEQERNFNPDNSSQNDLEGSGYLIIEYTKNTDVAP